MPDAVDRVADSLAAANEAQQAPRPTTWGTVRSVNPDGTVSVEDGKGYRTSVRAASSYSPRAVEDSVLIELTAAGPMVVAKVGGPVPPSVSVTTSDSTPPGGAGWREVDRIWIKDGAVWYKPLVAAPPASGVSQTQAASALVTYRNGAIIASGRAEQGDYSGAGLQTGLATFGAWTAVSGRTATGGLLAIHRSGSGHGFTYGPVQATAWRVSATGSPLTPPALGTVSTLVSAALNERGEVALTAAFCQAFCAGTANAIAFYSDNRRDNIEIDGVELTIKTA